MKRFLGIVGSMAIIVIGINIVVAPLVITIGYVDDQLGAIPAIIATLIGVIFLTSLLVLLIEYFD